jgi:hypothetical protein
MEELARLTGELEALRASFAALQTGAIPAYRELADELEALRARRLADLDRYAEQELALAQRACDAAVLANENDYQHSLVSLSDHFSQVVQFKYNVLAAEMPEPMAYFQARARHCPFLAEFCRQAGESALLGDALSPPGGDGPAQPELARAIEDAAAARTLHEIRDGALLVRGGATFTCGARARIRVGRAPPVAGTVQAVTKGGFDFITDMGQMVRVPLLALNLGTAVIAGRG